MKFYVSLTATEATTADGQPLVRGGEVDLNPEQRSDLHNAHLIATSQLISVASSDKARDDATALIGSPQPVRPPIETPTPPPNEGVV